MDVNSRAGTPGNSNTVQNGQALADQLVNAAAKGDTLQVIRHAAANDLNILSTPHSETGNTALHVAIKNSHVEVVGAITGLLVQPNRSSTVGLQTLLDLKNKESHSPLEVGEITPAIKTELLAGLSSLWPFCNIHKEYIVFPYQQECGCRVCALCWEDINSGGVNCPNCQEYLNEKFKWPDLSKMKEAKTAIQKYHALFDGEDLPACPSCNNLAFPPFEPQCGHVLCYTCCVSKTDKKTCQAKIAAPDTLCQEPLTAIGTNEAASQRFICLFSSQTQYGDCSAIGQPIREAMKSPSTSAELIKAMPSADVSTVPAETTVINGITTENCPHLPDRPDRYAVPARDRIHKNYYDDPKKNLKIEELEYRLEFSPDRIRAKLETARTNARKQQAAEQGVTVNLAYSDIDIFPLPDESVQQEASDNLLESLLQVFDAMSETLRDQTTTELETEQTNAQTQQEVEVEQEAAEQRTTEQHVSTHPADDDSEVLTLPDEPTQREASGCSQDIRTPEVSAMSDTLPVTFTATLDPARTNVQTQQEAEPKAAEQLTAEQHLIAQPSDDTESVALSDYFAQLAASSLSQAFRPSLSYAMPDTWSESITAPLETGQDNAQIPQEAEQQATEQHVIAQPADDIEPPALSDSSDPLAAIGSWQSSPPPASCEMPDTLSGVSIDSAIGERSTMEDAHIVTHFTITIGGQEVSIKLLGVFDGHGTKQVADHAAQYIVKFLTKWLEWFNAEELTDEGIWNAIKIALVDLSRSYPHERGGSTACVALIINNDLWIANLGDSRAILVNSNGEDIQLSEDAKPENETYKKSIEKRDGFVKQDAYGCDRVNTILAPARALADHDLQGAVSSRSKITRFDLTGFSGSLVLVCDGVTDVLSTKRIGNITREALSDNGPDVNIAKRINDKALKEGTGDNVSAIVALLGDANPQNDQPPSARAI